MAQERTAEVVVTAHPPGAAQRGRRLRAVPGPGAEEAFELLYRDEWAGLVALGWSLTGSWAAAEELTQDAFAAAHQQWDRVGGMERPGAWVRRLVVNRAANHRRDRASEERGLGRWSARSAVEVDGAGIDRTGDQATDRVGDPAFWAAVRSLPERQAACVALHYLEDRPVVEIAEVLGCRPATVKVHLHRGRLALAQRLAGLLPREHGDGAETRYDAPGGRTADDRPAHDRPEEER